MPTFAVHYAYSEATVSGRDSHRPHHREWLATQVTSGALVTSGPYTDGSGALLLFRAEDEAALRELLAQDPFAEQELIDAVRIDEWLPVLGVLAA